MKSTASIHGHPIHPMLVVLPIGLWVFSLVSDVIFLAGGDETWRSTALYTMAGGIVGAVLAAIPGMIDLFTIRNAHIKRVGMVHMSINLLIVVLFIINFWWRLQENLDPDTKGPIWLSVISIVLLAVSGWLGGTMVYIHSAGVNEQSKE